MYSKEFILDEVNAIRNEIGHEKVNIFIEEIYFKDNELWIITEDRPDKSAKQVPMFVLAKNSVGRFLYILAYQEKQWKA